MYVCVCVCAKSSNFSTKRLIDSIRDSSFRIVKIRNRNKIYNIKKNYPSFLFLKKRKEEFSVKIISYFVSFRSLPSYLIGLNEK